MNPASTLKKLPAADAPATSYAATTSAGPPCAKPHRCGRRHFLLFGAHHRRLLPAFVPVAPARAPTSPSTPAAPTPSGRLSAPACAAVLWQPPLAVRQAAAVAQACRLIDAAEDEPDLDTLAGPAA
jgi:hypothetical protein